MHNILHNNHLHNKHQALGFLTQNMETQNTQQHAFKPIWNAKMALQKITSEPTLKKSLHSSSIKEKNAIIERSKIKYTLRGILHTFGNGREILESLSKLGGFWMTLATEFLNEINQADGVRFEDNDERRSVQVDELTWTSVRTGS